jgi:hypothetical protein
MNQSALAFAEFPVDDDARDPLQGFGDVLVGELADILGGDGIDDGVGVALGRNRLFLRGADAGHHQFANGSRFRGGGRLGDRQRQEAGGRDHHGFATVHN